MAGTRDIHFVHAYIVYQLLSRRIQRDLLLISTLLSSQPSPNPQSNQKPKASAKAKELGVDARLYPAVVKLLETILQSLGQMRNLSIVDESPDLAAAVEARLSFTKARRSVNTLQHIQFTHVQQMLLSRTLLCAGKEIC